MGPRFESVKVHQWPIGQVVKTAASHAVNIGSNPVWVTNLSLWKVLLDIGNKWRYNSYAIRAVYRFDIYRRLKAVETSLC